LAGKEKGELLLKGEVLTTEKGWRDWSCSLRAIMRDWAVLFNF
jgi:hypothetical protein